MTENFIEWLKHSRDRFTEYGFSEFDVLNTSNGADDSSVVVTSENESYICQFTVRNNGMTDIEAVSIDSGELVYFLYCRTNSAVNYSRLFDNLFDFIDGEKR